MILLSQLVDDKYSVDDIIGRIDDTSVDDLINMVDDLNVTIDDLANRIDDGIKNQTGITDDQINQAKNMSVTDDIISSINVSNVDDAIPVDIDDDCVAANCDNEEVRLSFHKCYTFKSIIEIIQCDIFSDR